LSADFPKPSKDMSVTAITDLEIFARVARTGNMSAAGREMGLSPAVISKRVSLLEDRLGARLFQRTTRQLTLTETGEGYFKRVIDILSLVEEAEDFVSRRNTKPRGILKVSVPTSFARQHITPHLASFLVQYPDIEIDLHLSDIYVDIIRDGYDLAIRIGELQDSSLVARKLANDTRILCAAPSYLTKSGAPKTVNDLENHNCLSAGHQDSWQLDGPGGTKIVRVTSNLRTNSSEFVREAVIAGLGVGLRATWDIGSDIDAGTLQRILPDYQGAANSAIYAVYPSRDFMPAKVNVFIEHLAEIYGGQPYWERGMASLIGTTGPRPSTKPPAKARAAAR
jgi:DNA-binding transcriptional LysR family regulator